MPVHRLQHWLRYRGEYTLPTALATRPRHTTPTKVPPAIKSAPLQSTWPRLADTLATPAPAYAALRPGHVLQVQDKAQTHAGRARPTPWPAYATQLVWPQTHPAADTGRAAVEEAQKLNTLALLVSGGGFSLGLLGVGLFIIGLSTYQGGLLGIDPKVEGIAIGMFLLGTLALVVGVLLGVIGVIKSKRGVPGQKRGRAIAAIIIGVLPFIALYLLTLP